MCRERGSRDLYYITPIHRILHCRIIYPADVLRFDTIVIDKHQFTHSQPIWHLGDWATGSRNADNANLKRAHYVKRLAPEGLLKALRAFTSNVLWASGRILAKGRCPQIDILDILDILEDVAVKLGGEGKRVATAS